MKKVIITTFSDSKYFDLLKELISSIKKFSDSSKVSIGVLDGGLADDQIEYLKQHVNHIKKANWDIPVNKIRVRGRDYLKIMCVELFCRNILLGMINIYGLIVILG